LVRVTESSVTAIVYYQLGLFIVESKSILLVFIPSVLVGVPLGAYLIRRLDAETFRRICMSFDAWVVGFGLSRVLIDLNLMESPWAYSVMAVTILIDAYLLYIFFTAQRPASMPSQTLRVPQTPRDQPHDRIPSRITEPSRGPFGPLDPVFGLLGYVIAIAAIAMLAYGVSPLRGFRNDELSPIVAQHDASDARFDQLLAEFLKVIAVVVCDADVVAHGEA
jgi:hypothetical protein